MAIGILHIKIICSYSTVVPLNALIDHALCSGVVLRKVFCSLAFLMPVHKCCVCGSTQTQDSGVTFNEFVVSYRRYHEA